MALHRVFIPIVNADKGQTASGEDRLWEVHCGPASADEHAKVDRQMSKDWSPTVAGLRETGGVGRYNSGMRAYRAVERLLAPETAAQAGDPPQPGRVSRAYRKRLEFALGNRRLRSEGGEWVKEITGNSSDLGLALCLLLDVTQSRTKTVFATGALADAQDNGKAARDLLVNPVGGMQAKLRLLIEHKKAGKLADELNLVITPKQHLVWLGEPHCEVAEWVKDLKEVDELKALGIRVCPVSSLAEAVREAGADIHVGKLNPWTLGLWIAGGIAAALAGLVAYALTGDIPMRWESIQAGLEPGPYLLCSITAEGKPVGMKISQKPGDLPEVPVGSDLAWQIRVGDPAEAGQWPYRFAQALGYQGYHLAMVAVGSQTGLKLGAIQLPATPQDNQVLRLQPGKHWANHWGLDKTVETNKLILLARRFRPFDLKRLRKGFEEEFPDPKNWDFPSIEQYFSNQADHGLQFTFTTTTEAAGCGSENPR